MENKKEFELVVIESPYQGGKKENVKYAQECLRDSLLKGEAPIASHLLYTQILDDDIPAERSLGIRAGLAWLKMADKHVFYIDKGISSGMKLALELSDQLEKVIEFRRVGVKQPIQRDFVIFK